MGKLVITATNPIFPDKEGNLLNSMERGSNHTMILSEEETGLRIKFNKPKSDKNPKEYTVWGYFFPKSRVLFYDVEQYAPDSGRAGLMKINLFVVG